MRKETFAAIFIGILIGLVLGFGIWRANKALTARNGIGKELPLFKKIPTPSPQVTSDIDLKIVRPINFFVSDSEELSISGSTSPHSIVVVSSENQDHFARANEKGIFEIRTKLKKGLNQILISSFDTGGKETKDKLSILYSEEFVKETENGSQEKSAEERLKQTQVEPLAYLGTITDKTDNSLQIKNFEGEIQIVAINENSTFGQGMETTKKLKYTDVAIGDYIVAMGHEKSKGVLNSQIVIVTNPITAPTRKVLYGKIDSINKKVITLKDSANLVWLLNLPTKWKGPDLKELKPGLMLLSVGEPETDKPENIKVRSVSFEPEVENSPTPSPTPSPKVTPTAKPKTSAAPTPQI